MLLLSLHAFDLNGRLVPSIHMPHRHRRTSRDSNTILATNTMPLEKDTESLRLGNEMIHTNLLYWENVAQLPSWAPTGTSPAINSDGSAPPSGGPASTARIGCNISCGKQLLSIVTITNIWYSCSLERLRLADGMVDNGTVWE
jgi:hypothetical protein